MNFVLIDYSFETRAQKQERREQENARLWELYGDEIMHYDRLAWVAPIVNNYKRLKPVIERIRKGKKVKRVQAQQVSDFTKCFHRIGALSEDDKMICSLRFDYFNEIWASMLLPAPSFIECREVVVYAGARVSK